MSLFFGRGFLYKKESKVGDFCVKLLYKYYEDNFISSK